MTATDNHKEGPTMKYAVAYFTVDRWNVVCFPTKAEAQAWASRCCLNTKHRIGLAKSRLCY